MYINIESDESTKKDPSFYKVSFNIKNKKKINTKWNSVVDIRINKYVKGNFEEKEYKYYTFIVPEEYYKISINLYSPYGKKYIREGYGYSCNENEYFWEINQKDNFGRVIIHNKDVNLMIHH